MQTVKVEIPESPARNYPIYIGRDVIDTAGSFILPCTKARKILVVSNNTVFPLYGEILLDSLETAGFETNSLILEEGEEHKDIKSLEQIWTRAIEFKLERQDAIAALGGGVIGDVTGFASATCLRGVDFIQIPTTLLAQVDSSIGGKVAINHKLGKNLLGNFYQPKVVIADINTLKTLPERELKVGLAEVIKYGFIEKTCNPDIKTTFIDYLIKNHTAIMSLDGDTIEELVKYCCELKAIVVNKDEKEAGLRAILNFGHTIGHAIEKCYGYKGINHGEAVAIGMRGAFSIAGDKNLIGEDYLQKCVKLLDLYSMDYKIDKNISPDSLYKAMQSDKKVMSGKIRFVLPTGESEVRIVDYVSKEEVVRALDRLY